VACSCKDSNEASGPENKQGNCSLEERLSASREVLCSMELVN
jgi:hypothetical protein